MGKTAQQRESLIYDFFTIDYFFKVFKSTSQFRITIYEFARQHAF